MPHKDPEVRRAYQRSYMARYPKERTNAGARARYAARKETRERVLAASAAWREENPVANKKARRNSRLKKYGLTSSDYESMLAEQDFECAVCHTPVWDAHLTGTILGRLCVDHNHTTGRVRQLLCSTCNSGLGNFQDSPELLDAAATYLRRHA